MRRDRRGCRSRQVLSVVTPGLAGLRLVMVRDGYLVRLIGRRVSMLIAGEEPPFMTRCQMVLAERLRCTVGAEAASSFHHYFQGLDTALLSFVDCNAPCLATVQLARLCSSDFPILPKQSPDRQ